MNRDEHVKRALQATILHWPEDLNEVSFRAYEVDPWYGDRPRVVVLLKWRDGANDHYGVRIPFNPSALALPIADPLLQQIVQDAARTYAKRA